MRLLIYISLNTQLAKDKSVMFIVIKATQHLFKIDEAISTVFLLYYAFYMAFQPLQFEQSQISKLGSISGNQRLWLSEQK